MTAIAFFNAPFTKEEEIRKQLVAATNYKVIEDTDIIDGTAKKYSIEKEKVERALYGPTSVFNRFTHERERIIACLKAVISEHLSFDKIIYNGFIVHLIPPSVTHVLKVGIFDEKSLRIGRAVEEGLSEHSAEKLIKKKDRQALDFLSFLANKAPNDTDLYDIFVPLGTKTPKEVTRLILEHYKRPAVIASDASRQAVTDLELEAKVTMALLDKGYTNEVTCKDEIVTVYINKSVHSFSKLADSIKTIAGNVPGVKDVEVIAGKDYQISIYRDQEFTLPPKVLLVDDEKEFVQTLSERLNTRSYGSHPVFDGEQAMELLDRETPDVMVLDLKMPGMQGAEVLQKTKEKKPEVEVIILTGHGTKEDEKECMEKGAFAYLQKPVDIKQLMSIIDDAYRKTAEAKLAHS